MTDLKLLNQQIKDIQRLLSKSNLNTLERQNLYDTLTFLLDTRALLVMKHEDNIEENN